MIVATFTPDPTPPPTITQGTGTRYAQVNIQGMIDSFQQWRQQQESKHNVKRVYAKCKAKVQKQSVLGHWDNDTMTYQLRQQCGNDPSKPPTITIVRS